MEITTEKRLYLVGRNTETNEVFSFEGEIVFSAINIGLYRINKTDKLFDNMNDAESYRLQLLKDISEKPEDIIIQSKPIRKDKK